MATEEDLASRPRFLVAIEVMSMVAIVLFSIMGNVTSCIVMYQNARLRTWHNLLLLNVIITDLFGTVACMPFVIVVLITGRWATGDLTCEISGYLSAMLATVSVTSLAVISVSRYFLIAKFLQYVNIFKRKNVLLMILGIWLVSAICTLPPLAGWGEYIFLPGSAICFLYFGSSISYSTVFTVVMMGVPILVMIICFTKVYLVVKNRRRVLPQDHHHHKLQAIADEEIGAAKTLLCVVVMVLLCWSPMVVIYVLLADGLTEIPRPISLMSTYMAFLPCAFKPVIYIIMKRQFRFGFLKLIFGRRFQNSFVKKASNKDGVRSQKRIRSTRHAITLETVEDTASNMSTMGNKKQSESGIKQAFK